jgi:hypothetical protein
MKTNDLSLICGLPGEPLVRQGLADLQAGKPTAPAWLVSIARSRLGQAGLLDGSTPSPAEPELQLYRLLRREGGDAYSRYNALLRELISFEQALDRRTSRRSNAN